jgi:hypothetical protein
LKIALTCTSSIGTFTRFASDGGVFAQIQPVRCRRAGDHPAAVCLLGFQRAHIVSNRVDVNGRPLTLARRDDYFLVIDSPDSRVRAAALVCTGLIQQLRPHPRQRAGRQRRLHVIGELLLNCCEITDHNRGENPSRLRDGVRRRPLCRNCACNIVVTIRDATNDIIGQS